jgi:hypothetical protein
MLEKKNLPPIDEELIKFLNQKFPPLEYTLGDDPDTYKISGIFRAGQRDIIERLSIIKQQQEQRR